ncbi:long-chain fatty acid transport protein 1-like [Schistocerca gregaria]|uniref:long-chain fatty acid transport protein 1-like n=1 Tax=Schistocerca gregaria TaxID=7010 RepID=UPI00211EB0CF|nr:long-chain fatty acid transport protein 1-like [Schistocerca gregaria]
MVETRIILLALFGANIAAAIFLEKEAILRTLLLSVLIFVATGKRYRWFYILYKTRHRDRQALYRFIKFSNQLRFMYWRKHTIPKVFREVVRRNPNKVAFYFENKQWTFSEVEKYTNKIANYFKKQGYKKGDCIAVMMDSKPEFVFVWLGLAKIGVVAALINSNLRKAPLTHCITAANSCAIIFGSEVSEAISEVLDTVAGKPLYQLNETDSSEVVATATNLGNELATSVDGSAPEYPTCSLSDKLIYIYTSGTTGFPKAAVITHTRFLLMAVGLHSMLQVSSDDIVYDPLPVYHSAGGILGVGQALLYGTSVVIRRKFSASNYWSDCIKYNCTVSQYIGEMCRYLLSVPEKPEDKQHKVRLAFGNGLRPQIWKKFAERFGISQIGEFYGATEGNSNLINTDNTEGAVGFIPRYAWFLYPVSLIRIDEETEEPLRDKNGYCIPCKPGEPGVLIGKIDQKKVVNSFSGYSDPKSTEKKIIDDVFSKGDKAFNSGDILVMDEFGYYYFKDRTGDTFRWRGENVATSEVEGVISATIGLKDVVVYGVQIQNVEGRAGMAAIHDDNDSLDPVVLAEAVNKNLPFYARPLFVRVVRELPMTGTYKLIKRELQKEGYNPYKITDKLYFLEKGKYVPLHRQLYDDIVNGNVRL